MTWFMNTLGSRLVMLIILFQFCTIYQTQPFLATISVSMTWWTSGWPRFPTNHMYGLHVGWPELMVGPPARSILSVMAWDPRWPSLKSHSTYLEGTLTSAGVSDILLLILSINKADLHGMTRNFGNRRRLFNMYFTNLSNLSTCNSLSVKIVCLVDPQLFWLWYCANCCKCREK